MDKAPKKRGRATAGREARILVGRPAAQPPTLEEPTSPQAPPPTKPDQEPPTSLTATGR